MEIFKKIKKVRCNNVYVLTTEIVSNYDDGSGWGPQVVTLYYLGTKKKDEYYELFSGVKLEKNKNSKTFNKPYITKVEPLNEYLKDEEMKTIKLELLFDFITDMNVTKIVSQRSSDSEEEEE